MKKPTLLLIAVAMIAALFLVLRGQSIDLDILRGWLSNLQDWQRGNALTLALAFFAAYVAVAALSLPLAVWMTLAAGALFGFWQGLLIVSFASTLGATLAFLASRYLLRDWVRARLGARAASIDEGLRRDGPFFLFSLRLIPVIPFFAVNLLMGLTPVWAWHRLDQDHHAAGLAADPVAGSGGACLFAFGR